MPTLLDIGEDLRAFQRLLDETDGELTEDVEAALDEWFTDIGTAQARKLDAYAALIRECTLRAAARQKEVDRLANRVHVDEALAERLKSRLKAYMLVTDQRKIETARYQLAVQTNGGVQPYEVTVPAAKLPEEFQRVTIDVRTESLREALVAGREVEGAHLLPRGSHLRIR